jgi:hypothetical protein
MTAELTTTILEHSHEPLPATTQCDRVPSVQKDAAELRLPNWEHYLADILVAVERS